MTIADSRGNELQYQLEDLPAKYLFAYRYASKLILLIRAKTVHVSLGATHCRCRLFLDSHFEISFPDCNRQVQFEPSASRITIREGETVSYSGAIESLKPSFYGLVRDALSWYQRCKAIADGEFVPNNQPTVHFMTGAGWCEKRDDGRSWVMYFLDGVSMEIRMESNTVMVTDRESGGSEKYKIEGGLPDHIKRRMKVFGTVMKEFE